MVGNIITQPFGRIAAVLQDFCAAEVTHLDFGQVIHALEESAFDFLVVHLDHRWYFDVAPHAEALARAHELAAHVSRWIERGRGYLLLNTVPHVVHSSVESDLHVQIETLASINSVLFDLARKSDRVSVVDAAGAVAEIGYRSAIRERNRHVMQFPYSPEAASAIAGKYADVIIATLRPRRKVVVVDADNTMWSGIVGELGAEGIAVDRDHPGAAHFLFQSELLRLRSLGILLCVVTKNNEADFLEVFDKRVMPLKLADFVAYRSNWETKSENILSLAQQLNLGLSAFVFIDDNPFEIDEVRTRLPEVECHLFPVGKPEAISGLFAGMSALRARSLTEEDLEKSEQYRAEAERNVARNESSSLSDYLASLEIELTAYHNDPAHVRRIAQLTNKTNQFNLTCRRCTEAEVEATMTNGSVYDFRLVDKFGDMGIIAVAMVENGEITNFLMSCRALGRKVESAILRYVCDRHPQLVATFQANPKNQMVAEFYENNGFELIDSIEGIRRYQSVEGPSDEYQFTIK